MSPEAEIEFLNNLKEIELRTWNNYFPKEKKRLAKPMVVLNNLRGKVISDLLNGKEELESIHPSRYKPALDKVDFEQHRKQARAQKSFDALLLFYPQFLNCYALEIVNADELGSGEKILALNLIREPLEKMSLVFNIDMFSHCRVVLNFIADKIPQLEAANKEFKELYNLIEKRSQADDFYYWPLKMEKVDNFFNALESYKLIAPGQKCTAAFQQRFDPSNQVVWTGQNKQLIYLLFLLYGSQRSFKGLGIHDIACRVFKQQPELQARSLNNQLLKIIYPNSNAVRSTMIDDSLRLVEELIAPFL